MTIDEAEKIKTVIENDNYIVQLVNTVAKNMIEVFENLKIEDVNMFQLGYTKALDDFEEELLSQQIVDKLVVRRVKEQLKEGGENEQSGTQKAGNKREC